MYVVLDKLATVVTAFWSSTWLHVFY